MGRLFADEFLDGFGTWPLAYIPYGGADVGEVQAVAAAVGDGDAYHRAWVDAAARLEGQAEDAQASGHIASARRSWLKASCFLAASFHPIYGEPVDPRLLQAFARQMAAFDRGMALGEPPVRPQHIPFEDIQLPAYLLPARGRADEVRPLVIFTNGYDGTITDMYFASAVAASERGYHSLMFDGPGQGALLYEQGVRLRPDWETVVSAVVDFALAQPNVDPDRIVLSGWSLGGHLAPRAASGEHRLAALVADPGGFDMCGTMRQRLMARGMPPEAVANLGELDQQVLDGMERSIMADRRTRWGVVQRGFWVHGVDNLRDYLRSAEQFTLAGRIEQIRCPTLLTMAENDPLAAATPQMFEMLCCPKKLLRFTAAEGADTHCEMGNRTLLNDRVLDWLDDLFQR